MIYQACGLDKKIPSPKTWNFLAPPAGLVQRKQSMIVFSNGVTQSASGQSRAGAGNRTRHTTVTGENLRQFAQQTSRRETPGKVSQNNHAEGVYIINAKHCISSTRSVVYHQAAGRYTLKRDEIQQRLTVVDDIPTHVG